MRTETLLIDAYYLDQLSEEQRERVNRLKTSDRNFRKNFECQLLLYRAIKNYGRNLLRMKIFNAEYEVFKDQAFKKEIHNIFKQ